MSVRLVTIIELADTLRDICRGYGRRCVFSVEKFIRWIRIRSFPLAEARSGGGISRIEYCPGAARCAPACCCGNSRGRIPINDSTPN